MAVVGRVFLHSLLGCVGASLSAGLVFFVLRPLMKVGGLPLPILTGPLLQGMCFLSFGAGLGLSFRMFGGVPGKQLNIMIWGCSGGHSFGGAFSFFSIGGTIIGLLLMAVCVGTSVYDFSSSGSGAIGAAGAVVLFLVAILFALPSISEMGSFMLLDPLRASNVEGVGSLMWMVFAGYVLNFFVLAAQYRDIVQG